MPSESDFLKLLRRQDVDAGRLEALLADRSARRYHSVRLALAAHPRTPRREALSLVPTLYWRGLAFLSGDARVYPQVRRAADRDLLRRLPELALAERIDLARTVGRGTLLVLRSDPDPRILLALLDNRYTTEHDVVVVAARRQASAECLEAIASHPRWSASPAVRSALLSNPGVPLPVALSLLVRAARRDLEGLTASPSVPALLRVCAERVLARRGASH